MKKGPLPSFNSIIPLIAMVGKYHRDGSTRKSQTV